ncbi:helix-turn-helix domain-containing protein [Alicyclobacillus dauci]|uniref:Helix-turn-helix domain-containing protein n=1 Tax=Alicyclobacillus dauci TaxID=1475485 RepID=A0ABY6Z5X5_9BACL|nr:helix-turn-helix transcriptional regulator [Alicyclobacillus dauci]WAH37679.1 helix-turn-helix domain-containing protein [Alicyclobacillus dauci]
MTIGEKIRDIRIKRGLTQADLGGDLVTPSMISQIEADRAKPSYPLLTELANRLGMPVEYFMNELDDQFLFSAQLGVAMYQTAVGQPEAALTQLESIENTPEQGLNHQEYILTLAQTYRKLKRYNEATSHLEHLREIAYRTQDKRLLFLVCRECGYVEADRGNTEGALHEWTRALEYGEALSQSDTMASLDLTVCLTELLLQMDRLTTTTTTTGSHGGRLNDRPYLEKASKLTAETPDLRAVSDLLITDAISAVHKDPSKAKVLAERANTLLTFARLVEQVIVVQARMTEADRPSYEEPWQHAALAMTSIYPDVFLTTECDQIEHLLGMGQIDTVPNRISRVKEFLNVLGKQQNICQDIRDVSFRIRILESQLVVMQGNRDDGIEQLVSLLGEFTEPSHQELRVKACALLVLWYGELRDTEKVLYYCKLMEESMVTEGQGTPFLL